MKVSIDLDLSDVIEGILKNNEDYEIKQLLMYWDKGDCSNVGLARILLISLIKSEKEERSGFYDGDLDDLLRSVKENYKR